MRKKLLSLLTVLCMVLGMLPVTAMAAEIEDIAAELGYSEEEIAAARYIDEDTDLDEDEDGLIIIVAPVKVTVKGAKLTTGILVAPGAEGAVLTVAEAAEVNAIIVMATAEVVVEEDTTVNYITVTAPETTIAIAGETQTVEVTEAAENTTVTVTGTAEKAIVSAPGAAVEVADEGEVASVSVEETAVGATVTVGEDATAATVEIAAPDVTVEVSGTVETVAVAETATGAELVVNENAVISEVTDATGELTVSGDGAENVTVTDTSASDDEEEEEEEEEEEAEDEDFVIPVIMPEDTHVAAPDIKAATLADNSNPSKKLYDSYSVTTTPVGDDNEFKVVISARNLESHKNGNNVSGYWVGFAIPTTTEEGMTYKYYGLSREEVDAGKNSVVAEDEWVPLPGGGEYDTHYINYDGVYPGPDFTFQIFVFEVTDEVANGAFNSDTYALENAKYVLDIFLDITVAAQEQSLMLATLDDEIPVEEVAEGEEEEEIPAESDSEEKTPSEEEIEETPAVEETEGTPVVEETEQISVDENLTETPDAE